MGLFRPYDQKSKATTPEPVVTGDARPASAPKNRPTPTRSQAQAARQEALHPKLTRRQAAAQDRAASDQLRRKELMATDNKPERVLMRNYIDSRRSPTEFLFPVLLLLMIASMFTVNNQMLYMVVFGLMWGSMLLAAVTIWWFWQGYKRELGARYPHLTSRGLVMQFISRMASFRRMRNPPPTLKPGDSY